MAVIFILLKIKILKKEKLKNLKSYKFYLLSFIIFSIISNLQILKLENNFDNLYKGLEQNQSQIIGTIISDKKETSYKANYTIKVDSINGDKKYKGTNLVIYLPKNKKISYGDKLKIYGTYEEAKTATNYKAFDYKEYLKTKNVYGIVNVEEAQVIKSNNLNIILITINKVREKIKSNLGYILEDKSNLATRHPTAVISQISQKKQYKILKTATYITF